MESNKGRIKIVKKISTKEKIIDAALTLFAENGYDGTSVEQIAALVGIKAPSLYKHYKGKEDILNALINAAESRYEEHFGSERNIGTLPGSCDEFVHMAMERTCFTMRDPMIKKIRKFLVQEQFRNDRLARITSRHQIDGLQKMYEKIVEGMMDAGIFKKGDASLLGLEFIAPVSLLIAKVDRQPECEEESLDLIEKHLYHLCEQFSSR